VRSRCPLFQSLDWVERLSDAHATTQANLASVFQSLDWVERLSDFDDDDALIEDWVVSIPRLG